MIRRLRSFRGVFVPSLTAILGAAIFLILPRLVLDAGLFMVIGAILLAHSIIFSTAFSMADCATNLNHIEGGGLYSLARLSMGDALGGTIGIQLFTAQAISAGFFCLAFATPVRTILYPFLSAWGVPFFAGQSVSEILLQKQILSSAFAVILLLISLTGADFSGRIQIVILGILGLSLTALFLTPVFGIMEKGRSIFQNDINLFGTRPLSLALFFQVFSQFFPAVTGTTSGISRTGDLVNPRRSLVNGVFSVIMVTLFLYIGAAFLFSFASEMPSVLPLSGNLLSSRVVLAVILAGVLVTTGFSALHLYRAAPDTAQWLANDNNLPVFLRFLGKGQTPRAGMILTLIPALGIIWSGDLIHAARLTGIMFLTVYIWLNGAAFLERFSRNPGFRPTFRNHWSISLFGLIVSLVSLFFIDWRIGLVIIASQYAVFLLLLKHRAGGKLEGVFWGLLFTLSARSLGLMKRILGSTKNWRPVVDVFTFDDAGNWETLANLADRIAMRNGLVRFNLFRAPRSQSQLPDLSLLRIPSGIIETPDPVLSIISLVQGCHLGGVESNTVMMDYNSRLDNLRILKAIINAGKNILLMVNGYKFRTCETLDIWWRGERNGNLMVHLAFILNRSLQENNTPPFRIRIIRRLDMHEEQENARDSMEKLLKMARLTGEVLMLPFDNSPFYQTLERVSASASLIMMGLPGNFIDQDSEMIRLFNLDEFFFTREIHNFDRMPPLLFVKSARNITITDD